MNARTLKALKASIAHWERLASGKRQAGEWPGTADCALCGLFYTLYIGCYGCPVLEKTGEHACVKTPYYRAHNMLDKHGIDSPQFKRAAKAELAFLKSLMPKKTKP